MLTQQRRRRAAARANSKSAPEAEDGQPALEGTLEPSAPQRGLWLYLSVPMVSILLCGSKEPWALGLFATLVGAAAIFATPKMRLTPWISIPVLLGVALCLVAFLPAAWFPLPDWRVALQRDFSIPLAATRSPQPGITFESWLALAVGAIWLVCCAARGFDPAERRLAIRVLAIFSCLLACVAIVVHWQKIVITFWRGPWQMFYFGPFPNRNLFSELLAVGAVLVFATAYDAFRRKRRRATILLTLTLIPIFAAVLLNTSRAGVIIFFAGLCAWMFTGAFQKRSAHRTAVAAAVLLTLAAVFLLFGRHITDRFFHHEGSLIATLSKESRLQTYADATQVMMGAPVLGIGLGNFEPVFAMTREKGDLYSRALHPENDWLWFGAEAGIPCLILAITVLIVLYRRFGPWRMRGVVDRRDQRMRNAAGIGVLLLCAAGMVDPAMHAPGFFTLGCLLAGLAFKPQASGSTEPSSSTIALRRSLGVFCVLAGAAWFLIAAGTPVVRGNSVYRQISSEALALAQRGDAAGALEKWNEAATVKPLQWNLYFDRALLKLQLGRNAREALDDFGRARRLEPHSALLCIREFDVWQDYDPVSGIPALGEALKRDPSRAAEFFQGRVGKVREHPELRPHFHRMASADPKLLLAYLPVAGSEEFAELVGALLLEHEKLEMYTPEERLRFFQLWYAKGNAAELITELQANPEWREHGWPVLAAHRAKEGDFEGAYKLALNYVPKPRDSGPRLSPDLDSLTREFNLRPTDILIGFELCQVQRREEKYQEALATLEALAKLPHPPARILYERGITLGAKEDYSLAWEALRDYNVKLRQEQKGP